MGCEVLLQHLRLRIGKLPRDRHPARRLGLVGPRVRRIPCHVDRLVRLDRFGRDADVHHVLGRVVMPAARAAPRAVVQLVLLGRVDQLIVDDRVAAFERARRAEVPATAAIPLVLHRRHLAEIDPTEDREVRRRRAGCAGRRGRRGVAAGGRRSQPQFLLAERRLEVELGRHARACEMPQLPVQGRRVCDFIGRVRVSFVTCGAGIVTAPKLIELPFNMERRPLFAPFIEFLVYGE